MDSARDVSEMQSSKRISDDHSAVGSALLVVDRWIVREMALTEAKVNAIWAKLNKHKSLFSDLTRGDPSALWSNMADPNSMWFEVIEYDVIVGLIYFNELNKITDCSIHMVFFDRRPTEKYSVVYQLIRWMFQNFPLHRITATPPTIYYGTIRLAELLGFKREGTLRQSVLMGGRWNDQAVYGILRTEVEVA